MKALVVNSATLFSPANPTGKFSASMGFLMSYLNGTYQYMDGTPIVISALLDGLVRDRQLLLREVYKATNFKDATRILSTGLGLEEGRLSPVEHRNLRHMVADLLMEEIDAVRDGIKESNIELTRLLSLEEQTEFLCL